MSFPFPNSTNKWTGLVEAKHPLIQDLIRLWEESPGYILPQNSFIKDKAKLEAMIDSLIEMQKQKAQLPAKALLNKPAVATVANAPAKTNQKSEEDTQWEKSLSSALAMTRVNPTQNTDSKLPPIPAFPDLTKIPGAAEKLAELKVLDTIAIAEPKKEIAKPINIHILILYGLSLSAFILSIIAFKSRFF
jgi:hypothetical protein